LTDRGTCAHPIILSSSFTPLQSFTLPSLLSAEYPPHQATSLAVPSPPTSSRYQAATHPEATNPRVRALSAFLTLSGLYSTRYLPALFHAGPVRGVLPFRVHPTRGAARPLGRRCPPVVTRLLVTAPSRRLPGPSRGWASSTYGILVNAAPWESGHTSRPCSPRASVPLVGGLDRTTGRDPHGLYPS
jgi:hypothetical protein